MELCLLNLLILIDCFLCNSYPCVLFESFSHMINQESPGISRMIFVKFGENLPRFQISLLNMWLLVQISRSTSFNKNDLIFFSSWDLSHLINKLCLIRSLNLVKVETRISNWSKSIEQLYSSKRSDPAGCPALLWHFPVKF